MRIYISGIGGVAMGPLAFMARDAGYDVVGSDANEKGTQVQYLRDSGFTVHITKHAEHLKEEHETNPIDWFVHTSALPPDHPELRFAHDVGMRVSKRDEFINELLANQNLKMIAVAGTHGKTTTTAMIVWALQQLKQPISYSVGTRISYGDFGRIDPQSEYFVYEADEFDRNFLHFHPSISVITNIGYDHSDTYPDQIDYDEAFAQFIHQSETVYLYDDDFAGASDHIQVIQKDADESSVTLPGVYTRQNARLVLEMLHQEFGFEYAEITDILNNFPGTSRRMEQIVDGLYSDYAHHPDEIRATMEIGMELADRVVVVYQPHQNIRQHEILNSYNDCFAGAEKVYWLPTYLSREDSSLKALQPKEIIKHLTDASVVEEVAMNSQLAERIKEHLSSGAVVIGMAAGDLDAWLRENFSS